MSDNPTVVRMGVDQLDKDEAGRPEWQRGGDWLMIVDNRTGSELTWADAHEQSSETPFRTLKPGINVSRISGTTFSFSARYVGGGRSFAIAVSNPSWGSNKVNIHEYATNAMDVWRSMNDGKDKTSTHGSRAFLARHGRYHIWGFVLSGSLPQSTTPAPLNTWSEIAWEIKRNAQQLNGMYRVYVVNHTGQTLKCAASNESSGHIRLGDLAPGWNTAWTVDNFSMSARFTGNGSVYRIACSNPVLGESKIAVSDEDGDIKQFLSNMNDGGDKTTPRGSRAYIREVKGRIMEQGASDYRTVTKVVWVFELAKIS